MRRNRPLLSLFLLLPLSCVLLARAAFAQPPLPPTSVDQPSGAASAPVALPPAPTIDDPMLAPMPPAPHVIATWEQTLDLIRNRSTDLRTSYDEVARAEGLVRTALAASLLNINGSATYQHVLAGSNGFVTTAGAAASTGAAVPALPGFTQAQTKSLSTALSDVLGQAFNGIGTTPNDQITVGVQAVQPIIAVESWYNYKTAKISVDAARLSYEDMKRTIALSVANDLIAVITAERVAELNRVGTRNALERLDLSKRKNNLGAASRLDVIRAQQDVETSRATLVTGDESLRQAREALGLALGIPEQVGVTKDLNLDGLVKAAIDTCKVADSVEQRADVAAARVRLEAAKRRVNDVYYQFLPTLNAESTVNYDAPIPSSSGSTISSWNIEAVLNVPIWDGGVRYGSLRQNRALEDEARQTLESTRRQAVVQVEQARRSVTVAEASEMVAKNARALAAENDRLTRTGYIEGQGTSLELVTAAAQLREADITLTLRQFDLVKARVTAILALANCPW
jgi:multidrug efflux system outer membrane protein